jgi:hypothetical protein
MGDSPFNTLWGLGITDIGQTNEERSRLIKGEMFHLSWE